MKKANINGEQGNLRLAVQQQVHWNAMLRFNWQF